MRNSLLLITLVTAGCLGEADRESRAMSDQLLSAFSESPTALLAARQRSFLAAMADSEADPSRFFSQHVTLHDYSQAEPPGRTQPTLTRLMPSDHLRLLAQRLPREHVLATQFEVLQQGDSNFTVLSFPEDGLPAATSWLKYGDDWKVFSIRLNVPEELVQAIRERNRTLARQ